MASTLRSTKAGSGGRPSIRKGTASPTRRPVVTNLEGEILELVGIAPESTPVEVQLGDQFIKLDIEPNNVYGIKGNKTIVKASVPFTLPPADK